jgi:hypothetical protein
VRDTDIGQVLAWARAVVGDKRTFTIYLAPYELEVNHQPSRWLHGITRPSPPSRKSALTLPELVDDPRLGLFALLPRLKRYRRRQRWIRKADSLRSAALRRARVTRRWMGR